MPIPRNKSLNGIFSTQEKTDLGFVSDEQYTKLTYRIAKILEGIPISQANSILVATRNLIDRTHLVKTNTKRFKQFRESFLPAEE